MMGPKHSCAISISDPVLDSDVSSCASGIWPMLARQRRGCPTQAEETATRAREDSKQESR